MREKAMRLIVTFHTTSAAMAMEKYCKEETLKRMLRVCCALAEEDRDTEIE